MLSIFLQKILEGFFVKSIASFDDTLTRIPIIAHLTKTQKGRIAFSIGTLLALTVILFFAVFISALFELIPLRRQILAGLIFFLALAIFFEIFKPKTPHIAYQIKRVSLAHSGKLIAIGFAVSFITLLDDIVVLTPLFLGDNLTKFLSIFGVYLAAIVQIIIVIYFGEKINKFKYKKELASFALTLLAILVATGII